MSESEQCEKASREKWWSEIGPDEKIVRLRRKVKEMDEIMKKMRSKIYDLTRHLHGKDGELLKKLPTGLDEGSYRRELDSDDVYF